MIRGIFPDLTIDWWERACFELGWFQHGGSGLGRSYTEMLAMPVDMIQRELIRVNERREEEARLIREARSKK